MSGRSKREMAPPPPPPETFPSSSSVHGLPPAPAGSSVHGLPPAPAGSSMPGSAAPGPWWCRPPVPQQAITWWPATSCGGRAAPSSSPSVQKDDSDPNEWGVDNRPPGGFLSFFNNPWSPTLPQTMPPHLVPGSRGKKSPGMSVSKSHLRHQPLINLDNDEDDGNGARIDPRLKYTPLEEERLVVAWLNNSNDPINGNCKKTDPIN